MKKHISKIMLIFSMFLFVVAVIVFIGLLRRALGGDFTNSEWWGLCILLGCSVFFLGLYRIIDLLEKK
ncbi:MAG: hypothetical protein LBR85_04850 [Oscillospiraceae bacterium]|nr:hypothetical protein [Oscillospiraceae bacterium]